MSREQIDRTVREVVGAVLRRTIAPGEQVRRSDEPGWDSRAPVHIVFALEGELGIQLSAEELGEVDTVEKLVDAAEVHLRADAPRAWP